MSNAGTGGGGFSSSTDTTMGSGSGADVGHQSVSPGALSSSPGSDPGMDTGSDMEMNISGGPPEEPQKGIATRAAEENTGEDDPDNPARVAGAEGAPTTPRLTP